MHLQMPCLLRTNSNRSSRVAVLGIGEDEGLVKVAVAELGVQVSGEPDTAKKATDRNERRAR